MRWEKGGKSVMCVTPCDCYSCCQYFDCCYCKCFLFSTPPCPQPLTHLLFLLVFSLSIFLFAVLIRHPPPPPPPSLSLSLSSQTELYEMFSSVVRPFSLDWVLKVSFHLFILKFCCCSCVAHTKVAGSSLVWVF